MFFDSIKNLILHFVIHHLYKTHFLYTIDE